jgi:hypothetical protein
MSDLSIKQIMEMTDEELLQDLVKSGDVALCAKCRVPLQSSITGRHTIKDDEGKEQEYCTDCCFDYDPLNEAVNAFLADPKNHKPMLESELFAVV